MNKILFIIAFYLLYTSILSAKTIVVSKTGTADFTTVQEAINSIKDDNLEEQIIFIKNGIYKEKIFIPQSKSNICLIGESKDSTIITWNDHAKINNMGTFKTYTMFVGGDNIKLQNLTIENNAEQLGQAVALHIEGTKIKVINCKLLGNQDTVYTGNDSGYEYFENCYIEGTTDFIFGPASVWFEKCLIHSKKNSYITAASTPPTRPFGYIFNNCKLTANDSISKVYLGRPWRPYAAVLFMHCEMGNHILPEGWHNWDKPEREITVRYYEFENTGKGSFTGNRISWSKQLNKKESKEFTIKKVFPNWNPIKN